LQIFGDGVEVFLDFVHRLYSNKLPTFRQLGLLPASGKKRTETVAARPTG
jgi:hypothetical protein